MRSLSLLRLSILVVALVGAVLLGTGLFRSYWSDVRRTVAYDLAREARSLPESQREDLLSEALTIDPGNWLASLDLAQERLFAGELPEAERLLDDAVRGNPQSPLANYTMGVVQFRLGSVETALPYFEAAARADPGNLQYEGMVKQVRAALSGEGPQPDTQGPGPFHGGDVDGSPGDTNNGGSE